MNPNLAFAFLFAALVVEHTLTDNVFAGKSLFFRLLDPGTIGFSIVETVGATLWLSIVDGGDPVGGFVVLFVFQFIEHLMGIAFGRRRMA